MLLKTFVLDITYKNKLTIYVKFVIFNSVILIIFL